MMAQGKTVLITGASTGIGRATAHYFQQQGWNVVATMRDPEHGKELKALDRVLVASLDITNSDSIRQAVKAGIEPGSAGIGKPYQQFEQRMLESRKIRNLAEERPDMTIPHRVATCYPESRHTRPSDAKRVLRTQSELFSGDCIKSWSASGFVHAPLERGTHGTV
jgi:NAD(P)-dependent dehydrogenase (short-subunit alcohol dehydrogenase family)